MGANRLAHRRIERRRRLAPVADLCARPLAHMKRLAKILGVFATLAILCVVGFITVIEFQHARSGREIRQIVAQITPGTSFSDVTCRLGQATQTFTNEDDIRVFGTSHEASIITNSVLYAFGHRGPPYRWIVVYTDRQSQRVLYADSKDL